MELGQAILAPNAPGSQLAPGPLADDHLWLQCDMLPPGNIQVVSEQKVILYKPRWRAFYKTCLESHLRRLGTTTIIFTGCNFPNCPRASIMEKSERDFRIIQVRDAVSGLYPQGETEMAKIGVAVLSTEELLAQISRGSEASV